MKFSGVPVLLVSLLFLAVFEVKYNEAWWGKGNSDGGDYGVSRKFS